VQCDAVHQGACCIEPVLQRDFDQFAFTQFPLLRGQFHLHVVEELLQFLDLVLEAEVDYFLNRVDDELAERTRHERAIGVLLFGGPFLALFVETPLAPQFFFQLQCICFEGWRPDLRESFQGESPLLLPGPEDNVASDWVENAVACSLVALLSDNHVD